MNIAKLLVVLMVALLLSACGGRAARSSTESMAVAPQPQATPAAAQPPAAGAPALDSAAARQSEEPPAGQPADQQGFPRLVIKSAELSLQVQDVSESEAAIRAKVIALNGYIVQVQTNGSDEHMTTQITFRVPSTRFEEALTGVQGLAEKVLSRTLSGSDVTEEFVDLDSQLRNLEATRDRLLTFLDKANKVEDALAVNTSLTEIQGQIEKIKGRMHYLKQSAAMSTINVYLQPVPVAPLVDEDAWQPIAVARSALGGLIEFGQGLVNIAIVVLVWTPVWLPLLLLALWGRRKLLARFGRPARPTTSGTA